MAIALAGSLNVNSLANTLPGTITSTSFTPATGELIVVKAVTEDSQAGLSDPSATGGGITWIKRQENTVSSSCSAGIWTGVVNAGGSAITISISTISAGALNAWFSMVIERWTGAQVDAPPTVASVLGGSSTSTITTSGTNSIVSYLDGDWNATAPGTPVYASSATQDGLHDKSATTSYVAYYAYQNAAIAGVQTFGLTSPVGRKDILIGIEIQVSGTANATIRKLMLGGVGS